jgi:DNA-binding transcriptional regulator PaaX
MDGGSAFCFHFLWNKNKRLRSPSAHQDSKRIGFLRYGPALWVYPYDISSSVKKIAHHLGVEKYVDVLRADSIGQLASWKRRFKL